jgi:hypothetical protein
MASNAARTPQETVIKALQQAICGQPFQPTRPNSKHCRPSCRVLACQRRKAQRTAPRVPWQLFE